MVSKEEKNSYISKNNISNGRRPPTPKTDTRVSGAASFRAKDGSLKRSTTVNVDMETLRLITNENGIFFNEIRRN